MQFNYLITDQVIIPVVIILLVLVSYAVVEALDGRLFKPVVALVIASALLILFTDLQWNEKLLRSQASFDGVIYPTIETVETTMPVIFVEIAETGVITGGYDEVRSI